MGDHVSGDVDFLECLCNLKIKYNFLTKKNKTTIFKTYKYIYGNRTFQLPVLKNVPLHLLILYQIVEDYSIALLKFTHPHCMTHLAALL